MALASRAGILGQLLNVFRSTPPAVDVAAARVEAAQIQRQYERIVEQIAARSWDGEINTAVGFRLEMSPQIRAMHLAAGAAAKGGFANLTASDRDIIVENIIFDVGFLNRWVREIESSPDGVQTVSRSRFLQRARLYAGRVNTTFNQVLTNAQAGVTLPFQPGDRTQCRTNCTCRWSDPQRVRNGDIGFHWILRPESQHCTTCPARARVFPSGNPLRIRNSQVVDDGRLNNPALFA